MVDPITSQNDSYIFSIQPGTADCAIYDARTEKYMGHVWIDETGAWNVEYADEVKYLPINECLTLFGYEA